jgi:hypothetical protein
MAALSADEIREIVRTHGWRDGERDEVLADMAERAALDDDAGWPPATEVKRAAEEPKRDTPNMQNTEWSQAWAAFIDARIKTSRKRSEKTMLAAIGDVLLEERAAHRKEVEELRATVADLAARLDKLEGVQRSASPAHLRAVGN